MELNLWFRFFPHIIGNVEPDVGKAAMRVWVILEICIILILIVVRNQLESREKRTTRAKAKGKVPSDSRQGG